MALQNAAVPLAGCADPTSDTDARGRRPPPGPRDQSKQDTGQAIGVKRTDADRDQHAREPEHDSCLRIDRVDVPKLRLAFSPCLAGDDVKRRK